MPKPYPKEFRDDVVDVAGRGEAPLKQIAKDFGISEGCLSNWLKKADVGLAFDSRFGGGKSKHPWQKRSGAILLLAASGALPLRAHIGFGMLLAAVITLVVVILGTLGRPHPVEGGPTN